MGDANYIQQQVVLPPGVYFNPGPEDSVCTYLKPWIDGKGMGDTDGVVFREDVYADKPYVLRRKHPPGNTRNSEPKWWFFSECKLQSTCGEGKSARAERAVATGGNWKLEQTRKKVRVGGVNVGFRHSFGFYLPAPPSSQDKRGAKTSWLMEQYTTRSLEVAEEEGTRKKTVPVLCKIYISPRADKKRRANSWEDGDASMGNDGEKVVRVMVPMDYFDAVAALLPPSSIRGVGQEQGAAEAPLPPGVHGHYQGQLVEAVLPPDVLGHYQGHLVEAVLPPDVLGHYQGQGSAAEPPASSFLGYYQGQAADLMPEDDSVAMDQIFGSLEQLLPELTCEDYQAMVMGNYDLGIDMACGAAAGVEQESEHATAQLLQEGQDTGNDDQCMPYITSELHCGEANVAAAIQEPAELQESPKAAAALPLPPELAIDEPLTSEEVSHVDFELDDDFAKQLEIELCEDFFNFKD